MPIFSVKKIVEDPDHKDQKEKEVEINVPNEVFTKILFMLDGGSLHTARQVSSDWNSIIKTQVLGTARGRREMERTLLHQWRAATPVRTEFSGNARGKVLAVTDEFAAISTRSLDSPGVTLVNIRKGVDVRRDEGLLSRVWDVP